MIIAEAIILLMNDKERLEQYANYNLLKQMDYKDEVNKLLDII